MLSQRNMLGRKRRFFEAGRRGNDPRYGGRKRRGCGNDTPGVGGDLRQIHTVSGNSQRAFSEGKTESGMEQPHDRKQAGSGTAADRDIPDHGNGGRRYL